MVPELLHALHAPLELHIQVRRSCPYGVLVAPGLLQTLYALLELHPGT